MAYDITKTQWYKVLVEKCNKEPDKNHSVFIENTSLSKEESDKRNYDIMNQLSLVPSNGHIYTEWDGQMVDLTIYREPEMSAEKREEALKQLEDRFRPINIGEKEGFNPYDQISSQSSDTIRRR